MGEELLLGITIILGLGIGAQWLSWRLKLPAILVLLVLGFIAGPGSGWLFGEPWVDPDHLLGEALFPFVSVAVAIILFEGGLSLRLAELRQIGWTVLGLLGVGVVVTWVLAAAAAHFLLGWGLGLSALQGAILVVTGPTVIGPLLRQVRLRGQLGSVLRWEGILNDPVGAVLAVLVFEAVLARLDLEPGTATTAATFGVLRALGASLFIGGAAALALIVPLRRYWIPDFLQSPVTLLVVIAAFLASNHIQGESGLLAVTFMGILLANQKWATVRHIVEFKENLRVLLISTLFILLAARLKLDSLTLLGWESFAFLAAVMFLIRPVAVALGTVGSRLTWKQRLFLGLIAPRGVVAAAVSSVFAIRLAAVDYAEAEQLVPVTFLVIVGTIAFAGLVAGPLARWLDLAATDPQGVLFMGAHSWARKIALTLKEAGFDVVMVDTNRDNVRAARLAGLPARHGSLLNDELLETLDLTSIRRMLALTPNDEANALAALRLAEVFDRKEVYQLAPESRTRREAPRHPAIHLRGRYLFGPEITYDELDRRFARGATLKVTKLTDEFDHDDFRQHYGDRALPLLVITENHKLRVMTVEDPPRPQPDQALVSLIDEEPA